MTQHSVNITIKELQNLDEEAYKRAIRALLQATGKASDNLTALNASFGNMWDVVTKPPVDLWDVEPRP